jgi:hypothetical protein
VSFELIYETPAGDVIDNLVPSTDAFADDESKTGRGHTRRYSEPKQIESRDSIPKRGWSSPATSAIAYVVLCLLYF